MKNRVVGTLKDENTVDIAGRDFEIIERQEPGPATKAHSPNLVSCLVLRGKRGALRMGFLFESGRVNIVDTHA